MPWYLPPSELRSLAHARSILHLACMARLHTEYTVTCPHTPSHSPFLSRGTAFAALDNGGVCTFPYCGCYTDYDTACLETTVGKPFFVDGRGGVLEVVMFTVKSVCDAPLRD